MTPPRVDVVILTWNDGELLAAAVDSVLQSVGADLRVVVVDNGSSPPAEVIGDARVALIRNARNLGVAPARNQGVKATDAELVCLLDSDARLAPDALARLAGAVLSDDRVALAAPVFTSQPPEASAGRAPSLVRKALRVAGLRATYGSIDREPGADCWDVDFAIGACQLFRRHAFDAVGGLDESYFYGPEDVDFCLRLREAGWRIVQVAAARCDHPPRRRFRRIFTRRGVQHGWAVLRHLWRHRRFRRRVP